MKLFTLQMNLKNQKKQSNKMPNQNNFDDNPEIRLNRFLARCGCGSRRSVEPLISSGRITVNGTLELSPGRKIVPYQDEVTFDGVVQKLPEKWSCYAFHKPINVVSSLARQDDRKSLLEYRDSNSLDQSLVPVGRLDSDSSGLIIWTNDGMLAQKLMLPDSGVWKKYVVYLNKPLTEPAYRLLIDGSIELDNRKCRPSKITDLSSDKRSMIFAIHEGRNRQIRRMFRELGFHVNDLHRFEFGPIKIGKLPVGEFRQLTQNELSKLREITGA
jgi:16S rRNA pseudouridine516 synthase